MPPRAGGDKLNRRSASLLLSHAGFFFLEKCSSTSIACRVEKCWQQRVGASTRAGARTALSTARRSRAPHQTYVQRLWRGLSCASRVASRGCVIALHGAAPAAAGVVARGLSCSLFCGSLGASGRRARALDGVHWLGGRQR